MRTDAVVKRNNEVINKLQGAMDCQHSTILLFGLNMKCADKNVLQHSLSSKGVQFIKNLGNNAVLYNSETITNLPSNLKVQYTENGKIAFLQYVFEASTKDKSYRRIARDIAIKYGPSDDKKVYRDVLNVPNNATWTFEDGQMIVLTRSQKNGDAF